MAIELGRLAAENRCRDVTVIDLKGLSPVTDFFVVATGTSSRQMKTVVAKMNDFLASRGDVARLGVEGMDSDRWVLLDLVDVIVHVFSPEARSFYALELLWGDAPKLQWQDGWRPPQALEGT